MIAKMALYSHAPNVRSATLELAKKLRGKVQKVHTKHLRSMVRGGFDRRGGAIELRDEIGYDWKWVHSYERLLNICQTDPVLNFTDFQGASGFRML